MSLTRGGHAGRDWQLRARNETDLQCTRVLKVNKPDLRQLPSQVSTVRLGFDTHVRDTQHECAHAFSLNSKARVKAMIRVLGIYRELAKGFAGARVRKTARRALQRCSSILLQAFIVAASCRTLESLTTTISRLVPPNAKEVITLPINISGTKHTNDKYKDPITVSLDKT